MAVFCYCLRSPLKWITHLAFSQHEANISPDEIFKEIFTHALIMRARYIILIHNHPSGNIEPSYEDREVISVLRSYSQILQYNVVEITPLSSTNMLTNVVFFCCFKLFVLAEKTIRVKIQI